jgi:hypothetical protein
VQKQDVFTFCLFKAKVEIVREADVYFMSKIPNPGIAVGSDQCPGVVG